MKIPLDYTISCLSCFLILLLLLALKAEQDTVDQSTECGQYGFNCLNEKTLSFCSIVVDGVTDIAQLYECDEDYTCDEDNPSYCTPKEAPNKTLQEANKGGHQAYYGPEIDDEDLYYRQTRAAAAAVEGHDDQCVCETTTPSEDTTSTEQATESNDEASDFTTVNFTPASPFDCDSLGFFADNQNSSLFWHCDVPLNGVGFLLRHMKCGRDRYFDDVLKSCILEGTIRQERNRDPEGAIELGKRKIKYTTDCKKRRPGKYADEFDCHVYHLCLSKEFAPAMQLTFLCPRQTAYDCISRSCTIAAFKRCQVKTQLATSTNINCTSPMRFRSIDDCRSYFVCFVDNVIEIKCPKFFKFDDISMECLPEKEANCQEYST